MSIGLALISNTGSACASAQYDQRFCFRCLDSIILLLAIAEISRPKLVSVAEHAGLSLNWTQTLKTGFLVTWIVYWVSHDKTNKMTCVPSEDLVQHGHPPSLIRVFAVRSKGSKGPNLSSRGQRKLIRLGGCPG